jgi:hypothetical protein
MKILLYFVILLSTTPALARLSYLQSVGGLEGLYQPNGVALTEDFLFVLDTGEVKRVRGETRASIQNYTQ